MTLDEAWAAAEAALDVWASADRFSSVELLVFRDLQVTDGPHRYTAMAERIEHREPNGPPAVSHEEEAEGLTPAAALLALVEVLASHDPS